MASVAELKCRDFPPGARVGVRLIAFGPPGGGAATNPQGPDVTTMGTQDELVRFVASYVTFG